MSGLERAFADGRRYYVLAYVPSSSNSDGKFHSISVRLRESKMLVSAKRGYWANTRYSQGSSRPSTVIDAIS